MRCGRDRLGARRNENMTLEEERKFLAQFAKAAGAAELLKIRALKIAYEVGDRASDERQYDLQSLGPPSVAQVDAASVSS